MAIFTKFDENNDCLIKRKKIQALSLSMQVSIIYIIVKFDVNLNERFNYFVTLGQHFIK
jgi:hypothetical protein